MSKGNDSSKLGRATQVRELRDDELQKVSSGYIYSDMLVSLFAPSYHVTDGTSNTIAFGW